MIEARRVLILGGARSGKSAYAQQLAEAASAERLFVATAEPGDEEMAARIARHRAERGPAWTTIEAPLALAETLQAEARPGRVVLVDCLTLWLSNVMHAGLDAEAETGKLVKAIIILSCPAIFVSNEVGLGIVPETRLGRAFRDAQGCLNHAVAGAADAVVLLAAGLPTLMKPKTPLELRLR